MNSDERGSFDPDEISEWFWAIIDDAKGSREALESRLNHLKKDDVTRFQNEFLDAAAQLSDEPFLVHLDDDTSEDTMQDVAEWVVSQGKQFYVDVWNTPARIASVDVRRGVTYSGVADNVFWKRFGTSVPYVDR
jgi:hypothetical protein